MGRLIFGCFLTLVFVVGCVPANPNGNLNRLSKKQIEEYNADPANEDKIVCQTIKPIGSNIPQRECSKQSFLDDRSRQDQRAIEEMQRNALPPGP